MSIGAIRLRRRRMEIATARTMKIHRPPSGEGLWFSSDPVAAVRRLPSAATSIEGLDQLAYTVSGGYSGAMQGGLMAADAAWRRVEA